MTIALVGTPATAFNSGAGTSLAAPAKAHTTGNCILVCAAFEDVASTMTVPTDTAGNTYTALTQRKQSAQLQYIQWFYCLNATGHASNVVTAHFVSASADYRSIAVLELSHAGALTLDSGSDTTASTTGTTAHSITMDPSASAAGLSVALLVGVESWQPVAYTNSVGSYTKITTSDDALQVWYKFVTGDAAVTTTFTHASDDGVSTGIIIREASGTVSHPSTGALVADAAVVAGAGAVVHLHPSTGALVADAAVVAGAGAVVHLHPSTGALVADAAVVAGTGTRFGLRPSTGALVAQAATVAGTGARVREHASTGALVADAAVVAGAGTVAHKHPSTGALVADAAVVAGAGTVAHKHPSTGALVADAAVVAGTGTRFGLRPSTGALVAQAAVVAGAGTVVHKHPSTGALVAGEATVAGTGTVSAAGTYPSTGALVAQEAVVAGVGAVSHVHASTGALVAGEATLAGVAATPSTPALLFAAGASSAQRKKQVSANPAEYNSPTEAAAVKPVMLPVQTAAEADAEDAEIVGLLVSLAAAGFFSRPGL